MVSFSNTDTAGQIAPSPEELIARAEQMIPAMVARAADDEKAGRVSPETVSELVANGFLRMSMPARYKGYESPLGSIAQIAATLARGDHSVGWIFGLYALHGHHLAMFDDRAQRDVWGENPDAIIASSYSPYGKAETVEGGYRLSGRWPFCSGCDYGEWFILGAMADGDPKKFLSFLVHRKDIEIIDDWDVAGLKATGSKTVAVKGTLVPDYRTVPFGPDKEDFDYPGYKVNMSARYRTPYLVVFNRGITACSIGSLHAMIDAFVDYNRNKVSIITGQPISTLPDTQLAVGDAIVTLDELTTLAVHDLDMLVKIAAEGRQVEPHQMNVLRYRAQVTSVRCVNAARALFELSGGGGLYEQKSGMGRILRNLTGARNHPASAVYLDTVRSVGAAQFGFETVRPIRF